MLDPNEKQELESQYKEVDSPRQDSGELILKSIDQRIAEAQTEEEKEKFKEEKDRFINLKTKQLFYQTREQEIKINFQNLELRNKEIETEKKQLELTILSDQREHTRESSKNAISSDKIDIEEKKEKVSKMKAENDRYRVETASLARRNILKILSYVVLIIFTSALTSLMFRGTLPAFKDGHITILTIALLFFIHYAHPDFAKYVNPVNGKK